MRILVVDDHPLIARGIVEALEEADDMKVVGEAHSGTQALALVARDKPDLVLLDLRMRDMDGLACLERIRKRHPEVKVIMLSASDDREQIAAALRRGATAYILKTVKPGELPFAIRQALEQHVFHPTAVGTNPDAGPGSPPGLSERELVILKAVARGLSNKEISAELWVTEQTVKFHLTNIFRKLGVPNRTAAARYAHQHGLVDSTLHGD